MNPVAAFGEVRQLGYVAPAATLHQHITHWVDVLGIGPWLLVEHPPVDDFVHRGQPGHLDFSIANDKHVMWLSVVPGTRWTRVPRVEWPVHYSLVHTASLYNLRWVLVGQLSS